jgi:hypothetical protein
MYRVLPCVAVLAVALISGCGGSAGGGATTAAGDKPPATGNDAKAGAGDDPEVKRENEVADCMKKEGFTYIPHPDVSASAETPKRRYAQASSLLQPDGEVRKWRQKYGFGLAAAKLFPNDPQVAEPERTTNPNNAVVAALDPPRRKAYNKALFGAEGKDDVPEAKTGNAPSKGAEAQVKAYEKSCFGRTTVNTEKVSSATKAADHRVEVKFTNDPAVTSATEKYGSCMKERGHKIRSLSSDPFELTQAGSDSLRPIRADKKAIIRELNRKPTEQDLAKEVKVAVDDVECRSTYAQIVRSKYPTILDAYQGDGAG